MIFGDKVAIGPILPLDIGRLFEWCDNAAELRCTEPYRPANWHRHENYWLNAENDLSRCFFAIRDRGEAVIIGFVQISRIDPIHRSAMVGVHIGDPHQRGQGKGTEALRLAIDYCWTHLNLSRLTLTVFAGNVRAFDIYRRLGFREEGRLIDALFIQGHWIDVVLMALNHPGRTTVRMDRAEAFAPVLM